MMEQDARKGGGKATETLLTRYYEARFALFAERVAAQIIAQVRDEARGYFYGHRVPGDRVDDLCQEVSVRLLQALRRSRETNGARILDVNAFGQQIACNVLVDRARSDKVRPPEASLEAIVETTDRNPDGALPPARDDIEAEVIGRSHARQQIWPVVCGLPLMQRAVFLLSREQDELLYMAGTMSEVAKVLEISPAEFMTLWGGVPLSDKAIALRMHIEAQGKTSAEGRVSNHRKCACETLRRRLNKDANKDVNKEMKR